MKVFSNARLAVHLLFGSIAFTIFSAATSISAKPGDLDLAFGGGLGYVSTAPLVDQRVDDMQAAKVLPDGSILAVGGCDAPSYYQYGQTQRNCARRYTSTGELDLGFGIAGTAILFADHHFGYASALSLAVQNDGKVLIAGLCRGFTSLPPPSLGFPTSLMGEQFACIVRLNSGGTVDASFGQNGNLFFAIHRLAGITGGYSSAAAVTALADGGFLLAGSCSSNGDAYFLSICISRHLSNGGFDTTFNGTGWLAAPISGVRASEGNVRILVDATGGGFVVAGACNTVAQNSVDKICLISLDASGASRPAFGAAGGRVAYAPPTLSLTGFSFRDAVAISGNKLLASGQCIQTQPAIVWRPCVIKLDRENGALDPGWGGTGVVFTDSPMRSEADVLAMDSGGFVYASGTCYANSYAKFCSAKFFADGTRDVRFGTGGIARIDGCIGGSETFLRSTALLPQSGKMLLAGRSYYEDPRGPLFNARGAFCLGQIVTRPDHFDLDGDTDSAPSTDAVLYLRYLLGFRDTALTSGALGTYADRSSATDIATYLSTPNPSYPNCNASIVGAPGGPQAMLDGIVLVRAMMGLTGDAVTNGIAFPAGTARTSWVDIKSHLNGNCGMALN